MSNYLEGMFACFFCSKPTANLGKTCVSCLRYGLPPVHDHAAQPIKIKRKKRRSIQDATRSKGYVPDVPVYKLYLPRYHHHTD